MPRRPARLRSLAALAILAAITVGIPVLLIAIAGWPLPRQLPDWDRVRIAIQQGDIPAERRHQHPRRHRVDRLGPARLGARLGARRQPAPRRERQARQTRTARPRRRRRRRRPPRGRPVRGRPHRRHHPCSDPRPTRRSRGARRDARRPAAAAPASRPSPPAASACWQVGEQDNLWDIAERALGDGARAPEILELNPAMRSARDLRAGQLLRLPDGAAIPAGHQTPPSAAPDPPPPAPADASPGYLAETVVTIQTGDTLWDLSEDRLLTANGQPARPAATVAYLDQVIAANPDTIEDPNLIYAGEQFRFPAIGTPPPPPPAPPPPAEPPPATGAEPPQPADVTPVPTTLPPPAAPTRRPRRSRPPGSRRPQRQRRRRRPRRPR